MKLMFAWYAIVIAYLLVVNADFISIPDSYFSYNLVFVMFATPITVLLSLVTAISTFRHRKWKQFIINLILSAVIVYLHRMTYV